MTLPRGLNLSALLIAFVVVFAVLLFVLPDSRAVLCLIPPLALAALVFERLRASRYSWGVAAAITAALFAQPHLLSMLLRPDGPVWLALVICILATSAGDSMERGNPRSIILLSLSLAILLIVDPIGMLVAVFVAPVLMLQPLLHKDHRAAFAFGLLVLFLPAVVVLLQWQLGSSSASAIWTASVFGNSVISTTSSRATSSVALFLASAMFLPAALVHFASPSMRVQEGRLYVLLGFALIAAFSVTTFIDLQYDAIWLAASLLPVTGVLLASLKPTRNRQFAAALATLLCMVGGWATLAL
jgi:hypothetical protein